MEKPLILVADAESKNLQILRDSLESSGFSVVVANDGLVAWEKIQSEHPDLILSELNLPNFDGFQLLEKLKEDPNTSTIPVMFLTNRRDVQDRVRSLRGGVKDYMIKPLHVKEVIARVRMILRRISRVQPENSDSEKKMAGRIEEYSVIELIDNFGANRKSGVLQLYNEQNRNGEIWFKVGAVIHASFGTLKAEKAVYQMLPWQHGHFIMTFKEVNVPETINVSNLGLLLHGYKRMELREQFFKQLPSPETTFVLSEEFRDVISKKELSQEASKFLALIDGRRDIMQIVDESVYDDLQTLERLAKLHKQKFIKPGKAADQTSTEINISAIKSEIFTDDLEETPESLPVQEEHFSEPENTPAAPDEPKEMQDAIDESEEVTTQSQPKMDFPDFPPPDFDALDIEDEEDQQHNRFRRNGVRDHTFASRDKMAKDDHNEEPQTEELRQSPDKSFLDHFGSIEILVNNAGVAPRIRMDILEVTEEEYDYVMDINLKGTFFLSQMVANHMLAQAHLESESTFRCIINVSSISATIASINRPQYCLSKAGMSMLTQLLAVRLGEHGIPVYEVRPGIIKTDMTAAVTAKYDALIREGLCVTSRWGTPEDVGRAVGVLVRGDLPYSTGQVIMVDGGLTIQKL